MRAGTINQTPRRVTPPHSVEAEMGVLGSILKEPEVILECVKKINVEDFYVPAHRTIYTMLVDMWDAGNAIDLITATQKLRDNGSLESIGGAAYVTELATFVPTAANVGYYLDIIREKYILRETRRAAEITIRRTGEIEQDPFTLVDELVGKLNSLRSLYGRNGARERDKPWADALNESVVTSRELHDLALSPRKNLLGDWFCEGDLGFIFGARGLGKTWFALAIARTLSEGDTLGEWQAHEGVKVLYVDGEMPPDLIRDRCDGLKGRNDQLEFLNHDILFERTGKVLNITDPEIQEAITQRCITTGVKVLILDNLSTLASGMRENEADSWERVNNWLLELRRRKVAVVIVHHAGRSGEMRGTSRREDNVFWIIALDDAKKNADDKRGARFISRFTKPSRNTQDEVPPYEWHFVTEPSGEVTIAYKEAQTMDVFLGLIEDGVTECSAIADEMKVSKATISRMAKKAISNKKIIKKGREYFLKEGAKFAPKS
jgi:DnaB-like helicase N terminal domain/AAA domain